MTGIAVAMALAVLDADDLSHPRVEAVFTTDEEIGRWARRRWMWRLEGPQDAESGL